MPAWVPTLVLLSSFVLPHFLTIITTRIARRLRECYPIIRVLNHMKVLNAFILCAGCHAANLDLSTQSWLILMSMVMNRNVTECGCRLSSLVLADVIDEERVQHQREKPMSSSVAGLHAIASKPGQSFAPMIGWYVLRSAGYSSTQTFTENNEAVTDIPVGYTALLNLLIFLPGSVGLIQVCLWHLYTLHGDNLVNVKTKLKQLDVDQGARDIL